MKKKIFLVGALVAIAMSAMFVSCNGDDQNQSNGNLCTCTNGEETHYVNPASEGASSCAELNSMTIDGVRCW